MRRRTERLAAVALVTTAFMLVAAVNSVHAFTVNRPATVSPWSIQHRTTECWAAGTVELSREGSDDDDDDNRPRPRPRIDQSRIQGNQRLPTPQEYAVMDEMITKLSNAPVYEWPLAVQRAFRVVSSPQFFLRVAHRVDTATSPQEKERLQTLASNLVSTIEAVISTTQDQMNERASQVERVVAAAADPVTGEFYVPLAADRRAALQAAVDQLPEHALDEGFLSTLDAYMAKCHEDGLDLMIQILQKVLQYYAARQVRASLGREAVADPAVWGDTTDLQALLAADASDWDALINNGDRLVKQIQRLLEVRVIGQLEAGSMAQRVQAEFLQELVQRISAQAASQ
jgi:hypothetical protein